MLSDPKFIDIYFSKQHKLDSSITLKEALVYVLGNVQGSLDAVTRSWLGYGGALLGMQIDKQESTVAFEDATVRAAVTEITLIVPGDSRMKIAVGSIAPLMIAFKLALQWRDKSTVVASCTFSGESELTVNNALILQAQAPMKSAGTLPEILPLLGYRIPNIANFPAAFLLDFLASKTPLVQKGRLSDLLPIYLTRPVITPDLAKSKIRFAGLANGAITMTDADVVCQLNGSVSITLALGFDLTFKIGNLHFILEDLDQTQPSLTISGAAALTYKDKSLSIVCSSSYRDLTEGRQLRFLLSEKDSLQSLVDVLPVRNWDKAPVPFTGTTTSSNLSHLSLNSIGIMIAQPNPDVEAYQFVSIFAATKLETWKDYLPINFPKAIKSSSVRIEVFNPLVYKNLRIGVIVDFTVEFPPSGNSAETVVGVTLSALPLVQASDYQYGLRMHDFGDGVALARICTQIGLGSVVDSITKSAPFVGDVLNRVRLREFSLSSEGKSLFDDWSLDLYIDTLPILANVIILEASISLGSSGDLFRCDISGSLKLKAKTVNVEFRYDTEG
jgi:hypothetical protein